MNEKTIIDFLSLQNKWWYKKEYFPERKIHEIKRSDFYYLNSIFLSEERALVLVGLWGLGANSNLLNKIICQENIFKRKLIF